MTSSAELVLRDALALSESGRSGLADGLRESADSVGQAWDDEVLERLEAVERGDATTHDWDDVRRELRAKYSARGTQSTVCAHPSARTDDPDELKFGRA